MESPIQLVLLRLQIAPSTTQFNFLGGGYMGRPLYHDRHFLRCKRCSLSQKHYLLSFSDTASQPAINVINNQFTNVVQFSS